MRSFIRKINWNWIILLLIAGLVLFEMNSAKKESENLGGKINIDLSVRISKDFELKFGKICDSLDVKVYYDCSSQKELCIRGYFSINQNWLSNDSLYKVLLSNSEDILYNNWKSKTFVAELKFEYQNGSERITRDANFEYEPVK